MQSIFKNVFQTDYSFAARFFKFQSRNEKKLSEPFSTFFFIFIAKEFFPTEAKKSFK